MPTIEMRILPEDQKGDRPAFKPSKDLEGSLMFKSTGDIHYICGNCWALIATNITPDQFAPGLLFLCNQCKAYNEIPNER